MIELDSILCKIHDYMRQTSLTKELCEQETIFKNVSFLISALKICHKSIIAFLYLVKILNLAIDLLL